MSMICVLHHLESRKLLLQKAMKISSMRYEIGTQNVYKMIALIAMLNT